jgi:Iron-containing redox enzyme
VSAEATTQAVTRPSARLRRKIELAAGPFAIASKTLVTHRRVAELWPRYLISAHTVVRTTAPLLETAAARARERADTDPVAAGAADYFERHIEEERGHDEWVLGDLEVMGIDREDVLRRVPSPTAARLVGAQYYWVLHYHPVALFGYFAVKEGFPPKPKLIEELIARTGYPREAFHAFAAHGELDPQHLDDIDEALDSLPLTQQQETVVGLSAIATIEFVAESIKDVINELPGG